MYVTWKSLFIGEIVAYDRVAYKHTLLENGVKNHSELVKIMRRNIHKTKEDDFFFFEFRLMDLMMDETKFSLLFQTFPHGRWGCLAHTCVSHFNG